MKLISVFIVALLVMFTSGCLDEASSSGTQDEYKIQYDLGEGESYNYKVVATIEKPNQEITENTRISVSNMTNEHIDLEVFVEDKINDELSRGTYYLSMTSLGAIVNSSSPDMFVIPEIQVGSFPFLEYPDESISEGKSWSSSYSREDSYLTGDNLINYTIVGNTTYTCLGFEEVSFSEGEVYCADISAKTYYVLELASASNNNTVTSRTIGNASGENWVDLDSGLVIKSEYYLDKNTMTDYSGAYSAIGIESAYRKTPQKSYLTSELLSVKNP